MNLPASDNDPKEYNDIYNWQNIIESGIMIVLFGVVLVQSCRTTRTGYIVGLSVFFITANAFQVVGSGFNIQADMLEMLLLRAIFNGLADSFRQSGHWWFTFEYLDCAILLPYAFRQEQMPTKKRTCLKIVYFTVVAVQFLLPIAYSTLLYKLAENAENDF